MADSNKFAGLEAIQAIISNIKNKHYTKTEIDNMELITVEDIDEICGTTISMASEVMF